MPISFAAPSPAPSVSPGPQQVLRQERDEQMMDARRSAEPRHVHVMRVIIGITLHAAQRDAETLP